ncbi:hypothetical protein QQ045_027923 [Rhodiola kirilowii]
MELSGQMASLCRPVLIEELPSHLIVDILSNGGLSAIDLVHLELTCRAFGMNQGVLNPSNFRSLMDFVASQLCGAHMLFARMTPSAQQTLLGRCNGNWKRMLGFLLAVDQDSDNISSSKMKIVSGRYHTLLVRGSSVYSCGSNLCGVLGHGSDTTQCVAFSRMSFPTSAHVVHLSANHNHAAFVTQSGEVYTCGGNTYNCCGHGDINRPVFRPRLVEALEGIPCKQVAAGHNFTMFLTTEGRVYTCGINSSGQLGHGDNVDRPTPTLVQFLKDAGIVVVQISAGPSYALAVTDDGTVYSFGSGTNLCLGHGEQQNGLEPRAISKLRENEIHIVSVSAGDEHVVALDSSGYVHTWGKGYCGALGHGDEIDKTTPELLSSLKNHLAVQVCASKRKTFVLIEDGSVYGFGWTGFGSLGFPQLGPSDKVMKPCLLDSLKGHQISQISTGLYHTVAVTRKGQIFGFGDNERAQLGHDMLRGCLEPTEIFVPETALIIAPISKCE